MSSSIGSKIDLMMEKCLGEASIAPEQIGVQQFDPSKLQNTRRPKTPFLFPVTPSASRREKLNLNIPFNANPTKRIIESETKAKLDKINERNGLLNIRGTDFKTTVNDLEDLGELGNGTSGHVVKMRHKLSGEIIAVKQMRRTGNEEENKRIIMDLDVVLKSSDCKYIVKCLGCFITDADVWICMELMTTCFDKLQKKSRYPVPEDILGKVTVATVRALKYLKEEHGVIHRDVKPSNILIDDKGQIKLCDFGISGRLVDSKAKTRSAGCAAYMAPERIDPKKPDYDIRADVWSLGITLVELATGIFPYGGCKTDFEVLTKVLDSEPPRLPLNQNFSTDFQDFVISCLQKDYRQRPKYQELLDLPFLRTYENNENPNVAEWFRNVAISSGIQLTSRPELPDQRLRISPPHNNTPETQQQRQNALASSIPIKTSNIPNYTKNNFNHNFNYQQQQQQQLQQQQQQQQQQLKMNNINLATFDSDRVLQQPQQHYLKLQPKTSNAYSKINNSDGSEGNLVGEMNRMYKHSPFMQRKNDFVDYGSPKKESTLSSLGQSLFKNFTTSPFSQRKTEQKLYKPPLPSEEGGGGIGMNGIGRPMYSNNMGPSNPASPLLLNRKTFDISEEVQYKHLQGNTSPIVLQRFYHQQNQLRESKKEQQQNQLKISEEISTNPFLNHHSQIPVKHSPLPSRPPHVSSTNIYSSYPPQESNIPMFQYQQLNSPKHSQNLMNNFNNRKNNQFIDRGGGAGMEMVLGSSTSSGSYHRESAELEVRQESDIRNYIYGRQTLPEYSGYSGGHVSSSGENMKDDSGVIKRRYASFVKVKLANSDEKDNKSNTLKGDKIKSGATVGPMNNYSSTNPFAQVAATSSIQPPSAHVLSGIDRRHRSPDPPPRFNRGQSPLLLRRKLEIAQAGSPILHRRFMSASPPLPPRRGSESVPGSPQHNLRTKINYTPELQRRPYRTIDQ